MVSPSTAPSRIQQLVEALQLQAHPEGGWFCEVFRSTDIVQPADGRKPRQALTAIYFLLEAGHCSHWHRVLSDEAWVHLEGAALDLWTWDAANNVATCHVLGAVDLAAGRRPQYTVASGLWQAARPSVDAAPESISAPDAYTLVACMVGPGFDFADFTLMDAQSTEAAQLRHTWPQLDGFIPPVGGVTARA